MMTSADVKPGRKLSDDIRERLLKRIRRGEFAPGDPLPSERDLMQAYEVGRPAIREAMQDLQRLGLLDIRHGRRARVAAPSIGRVVDEIGETMRHVLSSSAASLEHFKEARFIFEMEMVRIAARKHSASDIARLRAVLEAQREASSDLERFVARDGAVPSRDRGDQRQSDLSGADGGDVQMARRVLSRRGQRAGPGEGDDRRSTRRFSTGLHPATRKPRRSTWPII